MVIRKSCFSTKLSAGFLNTYFVAFFSFIAPINSSAQCPPVFEIEGAGSLARMGNAVTAVGDVDADGFEDFAVSAYGAVSVAGFVHVISGRTHQALYLLTRPANTSGIRFGYSVAGLGDINQDGHADILIGVRDHYNARTGHAYVFSGIDGSIVFRLDGERARSMFGSSVAFAGDCNADGVNDFLISAPLDDLGGEFAGRVFLYSGADGALMNTFVGTALSGFGTDIDGGEDVTGDGVLDIVVSAPFNEENGANTGKVFVYSGAGGALLYSFTGAIPDSSFNIGTSLSFSGDLNADGVVDIIASVGASTIGAVEAVEIHSGVDGTLIHVIDSPPGAVNSNINFGVRIAGGGDINGDGIFDIAIGASSFEVNGDKTGAVFIYSGSDYQLIRTELAGVPGEVFGWALDISGDYDQDGLADLIVGAFGNAGQGNASGKAYMYTCAPCCSIAGDANHDLSTNIADVTFLVGRIFSAGPAPFCADAADANGDNSVNVADVTSLIARIFAGGLAPVCGSTGT